MPIYDKETQNRIRMITRDNVPQSNIAVAKILILFSVVSFAVFVLFKLEILQSDDSFIVPSLIVMPCIFILLSVWCFKKKGHGAAFQYVFIVLLLMFWFMLELMSGYKCRLLLPALIMVTLRYYNRIFTLFTYAMSLVALLLSVWANAYLYDITGLLDLNVVKLEGVSGWSVYGNLIDEVIALSPSSAMLFSNGMRLIFIPNFIFLSLITAIAMQFMKFNLFNILYAQEIAEKEANNRAELTDIKTKAVLSQVKPHFMYNALSSIAMYCTENPQKAKSLTLDFAAYLRNNFESLSEESSAFCSFDTELKHIQSYLNIEKARFEENLNIEYDIKAKDFDVPTLCIQPLIENAVKHGVCKKEDGGTVKISTREEADRFIITISDDGVGFDKDKVHDDGKIHVGISSIEKRLALYGGTLSINSTIGVGTVATVFIPKAEVIA